MWLNIPFWIKRLNEIYWNEYFPKQICIASQYDEHCLLVYFNHLCGLNAYILQTCGLLNISLARGSVVSGIPIKKTKTNKKHPIEWLLHTCSLWPSDTIWWQGSGLTLVQAMACCLKATSHYLNQCWVINEVLWQASESNFLNICPVTIQQSVINLHLKILSAKCQQFLSGLCVLSFDM